MPDISFVCGLGNPGKKYAGTRHNLGFAVLDLIALQLGLRWRSRMKGSLEASADFLGHRAMLIKPQKYMNLSGDALASYREMSPDSLLVVCDDIHLPLGRLRFRMAGGSGGHRGLESIASMLGTEEFARLRMGAGPAPAGEEWTDFVLDRFLDGEKAAADEMIHSAAEAVQLAVIKGIEAAQQGYNKRLSTSCDSEGRVDPT